MTAPAMVADQPRAPGRSETSSLIRTLVLLFVVTVAIYGISPVVTNSDSYLVVPTAVSITHDGDLDIAEYTDVRPVREHYGFVETNGARLNAFPWAVSLTAVPAVLAVDAAHEIGIGPGADALVRDDETGGIQLAMASIITALAAVAIALLSYLRLTGTPRRRRAVAVGIGIVFALGTTAWSVTSRALWQHGPSMLAIAIALIAAQVIVHQASDDRQRRRAAMVLGAALVLACAFRPTNVVAAAVLGVWVVSAHPALRRPFLVAAGAVAVPWLGVTWIVYGAPIQPYGSASRLSIHEHYLEALAANLVSPGRGLLIFSPVVVLAIVGAVLVLRRRALRDALVVSALVVVPLHWLVVSAYGDNWVGGHSYGPRFFSDVLPFLVVLSIPTLQAMLDLPTSVARTAAWAITAVLCAWSIFVHAQGGTLRAAQCWNATPVAIEDDNARVWSWSDPLFLRGVRRVVAGAPITAACVVSSPITAPPAADGSHGGLGPATPRS